MPSYSTLLDTYSQGIPCPPCFSFPTHVLDKWSAYDPNLLAILWVAPDFSKEVKVTYRDLEGLSHRSAVVLAGLGVKKGDRVLIQLPRVVEWW
jgi:acyl-coenzyme A synthetase/AMP-(fatty) acid ligase